MGDGEDPFGSTLTKDSWESPFRGGLRRRFPVDKALSNSALLGGVPSAGCPFCSTSDLRPFIL